MIVLDGNSIRLLHSIESDVQVHARAADLNNELGASDNVDPQQRVSEILAQVEKESAVLVYNLVKKLAPIIAKRFFSVDPDDLATEVVLEFLNGKLGKYDPERHKPEAFFSSVIRHIAIRRIQRQKPIANLDDINELSDRCIHAEFIDAKDHHSHLIQKVQERLDELYPERPWLFDVLFAYSNGATLDDLVIITGISREQLRRLLGRARATLRILFPDGALI